MGNTPLETRRRIITLHKSGNSTRHISTSLSMPKSTVHNIIDRYRKTGQVEAGHGGGRPPLLTPAGERRLLRELRKRPLESYENFEKEFGCSRFTVRNVARRFGVGKRMGKRGEGGVVVVRSGDRGTDTAPTDAYASLGRSSGRSISSTTRAIRGLAPVSEAVATRTRTRATR